MKKIDFLPYVPLVLTDGVAIDERKEALKLISKDLKELLCLPPHR
jgi:hypothetical protein